MYIVIFVIGILIVKSLVRRFLLGGNSAGQINANYRKEDFKIPEEGGALQQMKKGENGGIKLKLDKLIKVTHDTYIYRFLFPKPDMEFGLHIGGHVRFYADIKHAEAPDGELVSRKYTPISPIHEKGSIDFLIKIYRQNVHPKFPNGGIMTVWLEDSFKIGQELEMEGPLGKLAYEGNGNFIINGKPVKKTQIGAVCGGTGITPVYQVIKAAYDADESLPISLVFGNRTPDDILLRDELEHYAKNHPFFNLFFTVDTEPKEEWKYGVGFVSDSMLKENMPAPGPETLILQCGPGVMNQHVKKLLLGLGYTEDMIFKF